MAAKKRSQEEKNLKTLRELASLPVNKQCFDCHQRGPTYVNMTVGSFVCTSCSGMLRGLNPPHRVKSITMTVFTPDEIDFIRSRGNEYCRYVWLGTYDSRSSFLEPEPRDEQKVKDFMIQKYERKRWYVEPEKASRNMLDRAIEESSQMNSSASSQGSTPQSEHVPDTKPLSTLLGRNTTPLVIQRTQVPANSWVNHVNSVGVPKAPPQKRSDSLNIFESTDMFSAGIPSPVNSTAQTTNSASYSMANGNFANFESAFNDTVTNFDATPVFTAFDVQTTIAPTTSAAPDRYAALADLDSLFHQDPVTPTPAPAPVPAWTGAPTPTTTSSSNNNNNGSSLFSSPQQPTVNALFAAASANPFTATTATWSGGNQGSSPANPFQTGNSYPPQQTGNGSPYVPQQTGNGSPYAPQQQQMYFGGNQLDNYAQLGGQPAYPSYQGSQFGMGGAYPWGVAPTQQQAPPATTHWAAMMQQPSFQNAKMIPSQAPVQVSANPFMNNQVSNSLRTNPSNPFL